MRVLQTLALVCLFAGGAMAQRGGGGGSHGGGGGGGFHGSMGGGGAVGGGFHGGGGAVGGFGGGAVGGFGRGVVGGGLGYRGGYGYGYGGYGYRGFYGGYGGYWPYWGFGLGYSPYYYGYGAYPYYDYNYYPYYDTTYGAGYAAPAYQQSPNVTAVYPQQAPAYDDPPRPAIHEYDQYGQEVNRPAGSGGAAPAGSPIYLIAFKDQSIRPAAAYWVSGQTLHYVTLEHEERQADLSTVDRDLSLRLNRERRVQFQLP
jgi:hypothetical protein